MTDVRESFIDEKKNALITFPRNQQQQNVIKQHND